MAKNLEKIKKELESVVHESWTIASLTHILRDSLEYNCDIRKIDRIYLANTLVKYADEQKYKISDIKKDLFGI